MTDAQNPIDAIFGHALSAPEALALKSSRLSMDNGTFADTVKRVAAKLRATGLRPGQVVGLKLEPEMQAVFVAAVLHEAAVSFAANKSIIETYSQQIDYVITSSRELHFNNLIFIDDDWLSSLGAINSEIEHKNFASADSLALLVFSSGTTGAPKGVEFTINDIYRRTKAASNNWMPAEPFFCELGLDTVSGIQTFYYKLLSGQTYLVPINATANAELIYEAKVRSIKTSPAKLAELAAASEGTVALESLEQIQVAGGLLSSSTASAVARVSTAQIVYLYGSTEAGTVTRGSYDPTQPDVVGRLVADAQLLVTDESGLPVAAGTSGELRMRTTYQGKRYWQAVESGSTGFHDGWFLPGDTGVLEADNTLRVTGRIDELVNASGTKLNPAVIDAKIAGYRAVQDLAAFGYSQAGEIQKRLAIAIVVDQEISLERFKQHVIDCVPETNDIAIVLVDQIPRNALGKVQRKTLAQNYEANL